MDVNEIKEIVIAAAIDGLIKYYNLDKTEAEEFVKESGLEEYIELAPDLAAHCSLEQILDIIVD